MSKSYIVPVTQQGQKVKAVISAIRGLGDTWIIGYKTPTGRRKKYNYKGNDGKAFKTKEEAEAELERLAKERGWAEYHG